jgi:hypothetical protein
MSSVHLVKSLYEAFGRGDMATVTARLHEVMGVPLSA